MNKRTHKFWMIGGVALVIAGLIVGGLGFLHRLPWQSDNLFQDPQGRFTVQIDSSWKQVETDGSYTEFVSADPPMNLYMLVLKASTVNDAFSQAVKTVAFDPGLLNGGNVVSKRKSEQSEPETEVNHE